MKNKLLVFLVSVCGLTHAQDRWILLLDVSGSPDVVDHDGRLRREVVALSQVFLAAGAEVDGRKGDYFSVYFVGNEIAPARLPDRPLHWSTVPFDLTVAALAPKMGTRSKLDLALDRAATEFKQTSGFARKHLLLISDGELDVDPNNRPAGGRFFNEEVQAYKRIFSETAPTLRSLGVTLDTIAINAAQLTDEQIRARLLQTGRDTVDDQFLRFLEDQRDVVDPVPEGPYFLHAVARSLSGQSRPADEAHLADVVWQTMFPDSVRRRAVAPGSGALLVFARAGERVRLCLGENDNVPDVVIHSDPSTGAVFRDPSDAGVVDARYHSTKNYTVWLIRAPTATCVEPSTSYNGNNVELRWSNDEPLWRRLHISVELVKKAGTEPSLDWCRDLIARRIRDGQIAALAKVWPESGAPSIDVDLVPQVTYVGNKILRLTARPWMPAGEHRVEVKLVIGEGELAWEEKLPLQDRTVPPVPWWLRGVLILALAGAGGVFRRPLWAFAEDKVFWWRTRDASFNFFVDEKGGTVVTQTEHPRAIRLVATADRLHPEPHKRAFGPGPTAVFEARDQGHYRLRARPPADLQYRWVIDKVQPSGFIPLPADGIVISLLDFVRRRCAVELKYGDEVVQIRHITTPARIVYGRSHTHGH